MTGYKVYRGGVLVGSPAGPSFIDTGLTNGVAYSYTVAAVDAAGNTSAQTAAVSVTPTDTQAPSVPTGITLTKNAQQHSITVAWTASTDNVGVVKYRVYRNGDARQPADDHLLQRPRPVERQDLQLHGRRRRRGGQRVRAGPRGLDLRELSRAPTGAIR